MQTDWKLWDQTHQLPKQVYKGISFFISKFLNCNSRKIDFLDYGIGTGIISMPIINELKSLTNIDFKITGVDINKEKVLNNKFLYQHDDAKIIIDDVENPLFLRSIETNKYDLIFCIWFLHYINNLDQFIYNTNHLLKKGGLLIYGYSSLDLPYLTGQNNSLDSVNDIEKKQIFKILNSLLSNTRKEIIPIYSLNENYDSLAVETFNWQWSLTIIEFIELYTHKLCAKNIIDYIDEVYFSEFKEEVLSHFDKDHKIIFNLGLTLEILVAKQFKTN